MYKQRIAFKVTTQGWNEALTVASELNEIAAKRGWQQATVWTQTVGPLNELFFEVDYPDLATYERETNEFYSDPDVMALAVRLDAVTRESGYTELWQRAEAVAM